MELLEKLKEVHKRVESGSSMLSEVMDNQSNSSLDLLEKFSEDFLKCAKLLHEKYMTNVENK